MEHTTLVRHRVVCNCFTLTVTNKKELFPYSKGSSVNSVLIFMSSFSNGNVSGSIMQIGRKSVGIEIWARFSPYEIFIWLMHFFLIQFRTNLY